MLEVRDLTVRYGDLSILNGVSFSVEAGQWLMIVGPNGAGKSTIVNAISQAAPYTGRVLFDGVDVRRIRPRERAQRFGVLSQSYHVGYSFTVEEIVRLGRYAYARGVVPVSGVDDEALIKEALSLTGMLSLRKQSVPTLSGGELQRAFLAQVFAQNPKLLILDEPTNHLDLVYQKQIFELIGKWLQEDGRAAVSVVHDLGLARAYGSNVLLLNGGQVFALGTAEKVLTKENLSAVYRLDVYEWMSTLYGPWT